MIKWSIQEEDIKNCKYLCTQHRSTSIHKATANSYKRRNQQYGCNTSLTPMDRSSKQKINKETRVLNDTIDQINLIDLYKTFYPKTADYTFFSSVHRTFSRIDNILGHKSSLSKFKKIEIISSIFSDHNAMRLEMNYRGKKHKKHKHMEAKQYITE